MLCLLRLYHFLCFVLFFLSFQFNLPSSSSSTTQLCSPAEVAALIQFKNSFSIDKYSSYWDCDYNGIKSYPKTDSWKEGIDCCSWDGITCDNISGQIIGLDLSCSWLYGPISSNSSLFHLPHLQKLNLASNNLNNFNLDSIGNLVSLKELDLSKCNISGPIPMTLGNLSQLSYLDLSANSIRGQIPSSLTNLRQLEVLSLNVNQLEGCIPDEVTAFPNLTHLDLSSNSLNGTLPSWLYTVPSLKFIALSHNQFRDHIREFQYKSIEVIYFQNNKLQGPIPSSIYQLTNLTILLLSSNNLTVHFDMFSQLQKLGYLDLSQIALSFSSDFALPNLGILYLSSCNLTEFPQFLKGAKDLHFLDLSHNRIYGKIPKWMWEVGKDSLIHLNVAHNSLTEVEQLPWKAIQHLDLRWNLLNGTLPSWLYTVSSLKSIYLSYNQFSGHISEFQSKSLEFISFYNNTLQGPIPSSISQLTNLTFLALSSNNLSGVVHFDMFSQLQKLSYLYLSQNSPSISCNGTTADFELPNLQGLNLSSCDLIEFPQFLKASKDLVILDLSHNRIYGKIPKWMWDVGKGSLIHLNLAHNSLTEVEQLPWKAIQYLDLSSNLIHGDLSIPPFGTNATLFSNNNLSGQISSLLCNVTSLDILDLSHNNLTGLIPQCFGNLSKSLSTLNLGWNKLYGIIPPTLFAKGCQLSYLNINGNQLEGPLPRSFNNCEGLEVIDLGNNKIYDTFPHWMGSLPKLKALVLRSNQLHGSINGARFSRSFSQIQIFDLSSNSFTGPLPIEYIKNFKAMINLTKEESEMSYMGMFNNMESFYSYSIGLEFKGQEIELKKIFALLTTVDLSNNKFQGEIPAVIGKLDSLIGLNLSHNNLKGCIPSSIGKMTSLEWLDLSSNKLVGKIPKSLADLTFLALLNLSKNQLEGKIPGGKQFNTFGNDSYQGNKGLCGFPLSKGCNNNKPPPSNLPEEDDGSKLNITFGWKVVLMGYCCGLVYGLAMGYVVFQTGKPKWFVTLVEDLQHKRRKRSKNGNRCCVGRRI